MPPRVCFHYPCQDGAYAAVIAYLHFVRIGVEATFHPLAVYAKEETRIELTKTWGKDDDVYLLDFSGGVSFLKAACARTFRVHLIDHHKTALEDMESLQKGEGKPENLDISFLDMARSGASLSRDFFAAMGTVVSDDLRAVIGLVEDNDLWKHALADSRAFAAGFADLRLECDPSKNAGVWPQILALSTQKVIDGGRASIARDASIIKSEADASFTVRVPAASDGAPAFETLAVFTAHPGLRSEAGNLLAVKSKESNLAPCGIIAYVEKAAPDQVKVSFRSVDGFDTTPYARAFGGGGHAAASSCMVTVSEWASWRLN